MVGGNFQFGIRQNFQIFERIKVVKFGSFLILCLFLGV